MNAKNIKIAVGIVVATMFALLVFAKVNAFRFVPWMVPVAVLVAFYFGGKVIKKAGTSAGWMTDFGWRLLVSRTIGTLTAVFAGWLVFLHFPGCWPIGLTLIVSAVAWAFYMKPLLARTDWKKPEGAALARIYLEVETAVMWFCLLLAGFGTWALIRQLPSLSGCAVVLGLLFIAGKGWERWFLARSNNAWDNKIETLKTMVVSQKDVISTGGDSIDATALCEVLKGLKGFLEPYRHYFWNRLERAQFFAVATAIEALEAVEKEIANINTMCAKFRADQADWDAKIEGTTEIDKLAELRKDKASDALATQANILRAIQTLEMHVDDLPKNYPSLGSALFFAHVGYWSKPFLGVIALIAIAILIEAVALLVFNQEDRIVPAPPDRPEASMPHEWYGDGSSEEDFRKFREAAKESIRKSIEAND